MFEYHVHTARTTQGLWAELEKREEDGWEAIEVLPSMKGWFAFFLGSLGTQYTVIFRRRLKDA